MENGEEGRNGELAQKTESTGKCNPGSIVRPSVTSTVMIPSGRFFKNMQFTNVNAGVSLVHEKSGKSEFWKRHDWTLGVKSVSTFRNFMPNCTLSKVFWI
jgi:hypothetical protein